MRHFRIASAIVAATLMVPATRAQTITLREPEMIAELLRVEGYEAEVDTRKDDADPSLSANYDGLKFGLFFWNCEKTRDCQSVEFYAGFKNHQLDLEKLNLWNRERRFARAYLDEEGDAVITMDLNVEPGGLERKLFVDSLNIWSSLLAQFEERAYPSQPDDKAKSAK